MSNSASHLDRLSELFSDAERRRQQKAEDAQKEKEERRAKAKRDRMLKAADEGLAAKVYALMASEIVDTRTGHPLIGVTAADLMYLAFPEENANSIRFALWALARVGKIGKTGAKRNSGTGTRNLDVWDIITKCPPQVNLEPRYALAFVSEAGGELLVASYLRKAEVDEAVRMQRGPGVVKVYRLQLIREVPVSE